MENSTRSEQVTRRIAAGELVLLLLTGPLFLFIRPSLLPVLLLVPFLWVVRWRIRGHFIPRTPVDWPVLGLLAMTLVSVWVTPDLSVSLNKVVGLIYALALFYALVEWGRRQRDLSLVALLVIGLGSAIALFSLFGTQWSVKWSLLEKASALLPRLVGSLPGAEFGFNPNTVSGTLITFIPLQLALLGGLLAADNRQQARPPRLALVTAFSLVPTVAIIVLAQSRSAWAALLLGLLIMAAILTPKLRPIFIALILIGLVAVLVIGPVGLSEWLTQQGWMTGSAEISWLGRAERWSRWLWAIADHPLSGWGMDIFRYAAWDTYPFFYAIPGKELSHGHNIFLNTAVDLGIPGLVSYLALLGSTLTLGWRSYRQAARRTNRLIALGGIVGLGAHTLWSLVDALPLGARTNFLWWTVVAVVIAVVVRSDSTGSEP